jgi:hypothetical protein
MLVLLARQLASIVIAEPISLAGPWPANLPSLIPLPLILRCNYIVLYFHY